MTIAPALDGFRAVLFDLDGVLTPTVAVHMRAWSRLFTDFVRARSIVPGYSDADYFAYIDGKPRYDGVASFLASRNVHVPYGDPSDPPDRETVCGLGNKKNDLFNAVLAADGVQPYPGSVRFLDTLAEAGLAVAVVSSSKNAVSVLAAAGLRDRFEVVVDGTTAAAEQLAGKPRPDTFIRAAELLGVPVSAAVVVEDAISGVEAGRAGEFGLVIGVDRGVGVEALSEGGATIVVADLAELVVPHAETPAL